jgi:hypothetical protein
VPPGIGQNVAGLRGVAAGNLGVRALYDEMMQLANVGLGKRRPSARQRADIADRLVMVDRFQMILERLAADRDPLLDDERRLGGAQCIPLDRVRRVGQLEIMNVLKVAETGAYS